MFERNGQKLGSVIHEVTEPGGADDETVDPYESTTVAELKEQLAERGLPVSGTKAELWERLQGADDESSDDEEDSDGGDDSE